MMTKGSRMARKKKKHKRKVSKMKDFYAKRQRKGLIGFGVLILVISALLIGWTMNVYKLAVSDFEPSYKEEVIRAIGVFVPPIGIVAGYINFEETQTEGK